jgi:hypothetical protein
MVELKAGCLALGVLLLPACGGVARSSSESASGASSLGVSSGSGNSGVSAGSTGTSFGGTSSSAPINPPSGGGGASAAGSDSTSMVAGGGSSLGSAGAPVVVTRAALPCSSPTARPHGGGYTSCSDGSLRRVSAAACDAALPRASADLPLALTECANDTDCVASAHGYCAYGGCKYGCVTDAECASDQACFCGDFIGTCTPANCRSDADCPTDFPCTAYQAVGFATPDELACQSPEDQCLTDAQCGSLNPRVSCKVQVDHRVCFLDPIG